MKRFKVILLILFVLYFALAIPFLYYATNDYATNSLFSRFWFLAYPLLVLLFFPASGLSIFSILSLITLFIFLFKNKYVLALTLLVVSVLLLASIFIPKTVTDDGPPVSDLRFGLPIPFVSHQSLNDPPMPWTVRVTDRSINKVLWPQFSLSFIILFSLFLAIFSSARRLVKVKQVHQETGAETQ